MPKPNNAVTRQAGMCQNHVAGFEGHSPQSLFLFQQDCPRDLHKTKRPFSQGVQTYRCVLLHLSSQKSFSQSDTLRQQLSVLGSVLELLARAVCTHAHTVCTRPPNKTGGGNMITRFTGALDPEEGATHRRWPCHERIGGTSKQDNEVGACLPGRPKPS